VTMTERNAKAWAHLQPKWREQRMREWAEMLEHRVKQLDPYYQVFPWGRRDVADVLDSNGQRIRGTYTMPV
jgi:hypothetical protein